MSKACGQGLGISSRTRLNTLPFHQVTSVEGANALISFFYLGGIQTKLFSYSFPILELNILSFMILQKLAVYALVFLDFFQEQRSIKRLSSG